MRKLKLMTILYASALLFWTSCGDPLPIEELVAAKSAINRASSIKAEQYAADEMTAATAKLFEAHNFMKDDAPKDAVASAQEAKRLADEAYNKACPIIAKETIEIAGQSLAEAEAAGADETVSPEYVEAKAAYVAAGQDYDNKNYVEAYNKALVADAKAKEARNAALGKKDILKDSLDEIRLIVQRAREYNAEEYAPENLRLADENLQAADNAYADQKLKAGFSAAEVAKINADEAYLKASKETATNEIANAKILLEKAQVAGGGKASSDELAAAQESCRNAEEMYSEGRYKEAIDYAKESALLSNIVIAQKDKGKDGTLTKAGGDDETGDYFFYTVVYRAQAKDCLWRIADKYYDNPRQWKRIYEANKDKIKDPDLIYPGWVLKVPKIKK